MTSNVVALTVKLKPVITAQPVGKTVNEGSKATFTVKAQNAESYQWQYKAPGSTVWKNITAASGKKATYSVTTAAKHNGYQYRCKVTNAVGTVTSSVVKLTVKLKPVIKTQPSSKTVTARKKVTFTVTAAGEGLKYQWYYSTDKGKTWKAVTAAAGKKASYSFTAAKKQSGYQYRCKVTNSVGAVTSKTVTLTVK